MAEQFAAVEVLKAEPPVAEVGSVEVGLGLGVVRHKPFLPRVPELPKPYCGQVAAVSPLA